MGVFKQDVLETMLGIRFEKRAVVLGPNTPSDFYI